MNFSLFYYSINIEGKSGKETKINAMIKWNN